MAHYIAFVILLHILAVGLNDCGEGELEVVVMSCHGRPVLNQVTVLEPGRLEVNYEPMEGGLHFAEVTFNKEHVTGASANQKSAGIIIPIHTLYVESGIK